VGDWVLRVGKGHRPAVAHPERRTDGVHTSVQEARDAVRAGLQAARDGQCQQQLPSVDDDEPSGGPGDPPIFGTKTESLPIFEAKTESLPIFDAKTESLPPIIIESATATPKVEVSLMRAPIDMAALTRTTPTPGYFYQVHEGEPFFGDDGILARALHQAVLDAAKTKGWSTAKAHARAATLAADAKARVAYLSVIQCGPWNDAMYATWGYGPNDRPAAHGRAIRLIARHDRVYERLANGQAPIRTLDRGLPVDKGTGAATGAGDMPELLWLPPLRSDALLDANRVRQVVAEGLVWADGSSKINPPPAVQELGIENAPAGPWGCKGVAA